VDENSAFTSANEMIKTEASPLTSHTESTIESKDVPARPRNLTAELFNSLLEELPEYRHRINEAFQNREFELLQEETHKLHGHSSYCNVPMLKSAVQQLERAARRGHFETISKCLVAVNEEIALLIQTANHI
jgi:two-component system, NarL family, sensor histidine kinase BarA